MHSGNRRPMQGQGRPMPPSHNPLPPQSMVYQAPKLWNVQIPKLPTEEPFIPDVYLPNGTEQEDKLSVEMIEHGYRDPPVPNEFGNLRHYFRQRLADVADTRSRVGIEIDVLNWWISCRTKTSSVSDVYNTPSTSGTMTEPQKQEWMKQFVNPELRVNSLKTIPHFKNQTLIKSLADFDVPFPKALWLIKAFTRDMRQGRDNFAESLADAIRAAASVLYSSTSMPGTAVPTQHGVSLPPASRATPSLNPSRTESPVPPGSIPSSNTPILGSATAGLSRSSTNAGSDLSSSSANIQFPKLVKPVTSLTLEQQSAKTQLNYLIQLLSWVYRDGFIPLDIVTNQFSKDLGVCNDSVACLYIALIFQFLPDIIINSPALEKLKTILQILAEKFKGPLKLTSSAAEKSLKDGTSSSMATNSSTFGNMPASTQSASPARLRLYSLYCSTLKVMVAYLPDFLDPLHLEFLRQCMATAYGDNTTASNSSAGPYEASPGTPSASTWLNLASNNSLSYALGQNPAAKLLQLQLPNGTATSNNLCSLSTYHLNSSQLSCLHLLYQNINANRVQISVDAACYDQVSALLATTLGEGAPAPDGIASAPTSKSHLMHSLDILDEFSRHLDLDEAFHRFFHGNHGSPNSARAPSPSNQLAGVSSSGKDAITQQCIYASCTGVDCEDLERTVQLLLSWATSSFRSGVHRIFLASSLLRRYLQHNASATELVYDILINFMDNQPRYAEKKNCSELDSILMATDDPVAALPLAQPHTRNNEMETDECGTDMVVPISLLVGEVIRNKAFSHDKYLRRLIARGILLQTQMDALDPDSASEKHKAFLLNIPLFGECKHDRNQRKMVIARYLTGVDECAQLELGYSLINQAFFLRKTSPTTEGNSAWPSSTSDADKAVSDHFASLSLFCRSSICQYTINSIKWLMTTHYSDSIDQLKPAALEETLSLDVLELPIQRLILKLYMLLQSISDIRSLLDFARWLLDRSLHWDIGPEIVNKCVLPVLSSYENVLFTLDISIPPLLDRLLVHCQRSKAPLSIPTAAFLLKLVSRHSNLKFVSAWAAEKAALLDAVKRSVALKPRTKPSTDITNLHDPQAISAKQFIEGLHFASEKSMLLTPTTQPVPVISTPSGIISLIESATELWINRLKSLNRTKTGFGIGIALQEYCPSALPCVLASALSNTLQQSDLRSALLSFIWGSKFRAYLAQPGLEMALATWIDRLCYVFTFNGSLVLSLISNIAQRVVSSFATLEEPFVIFTVHLMQLVSWCSLQSRLLGANDCAAPVRWLHVLGRPVKTKQIQLFVSFCDLVLTRLGTDAFRHTPSAEYEPNTLRWFLGESLLNLPHADIYSIFKSLGDPKRAFRLCSRIFEEHGAPSITMSSSSEIANPNAMEGQSTNDALDSSLSSQSDLENKINFILTGTHLWSVRFTWLQIQLLLDAANSNTAGKQANDLFASTLMYKLSANQLNSNNSLVKQGESESAGDLSDALTNLLRRLEPGIRLAVLTYLFRLLEPSKSMQRYNLSAALLGPSVDLSKSTDEEAGLSVAKVERRLVELLLSTAACCLDAQQTSFPIDEVLESHYTYIEEFLLPHLNDLSKWREIRIQLYIRLSLMRWLLPSDSDSSSTTSATSASTIATQSSQPPGAAPSQGGSASAPANRPSTSTILDKLTVLLMKLLAAPVLQEDVLDGKDLWTLALHTFASLKNCQKQPATRRALTELYPTLTMPSHLRIRLEPVLQSVARKDRPVYLNNASRVILPKGLEPHKHLEEQPDQALLNAFGARRIPSRQLTYASHLLSNTQRLMNQATQIKLDPPTARQKRPGGDFPDPRPPLPQPR